MVSTSRRMAAQAGVEACRRGCRPRGLDGLPFGGHPVQPAVGGDGGGDGEPEAGADLLARVAESQVETAAGPAELRRRLGAGYRAGVDEQVEKGGWRGGDPLGMSITKSSGNETLGAITLQEILQQPDLWPTSFARTKRVNHFDPANAILTGAGTSAYAAEAIAGAWPGAKAIHSGDLLVSSRKEIEARNPRFVERGTLVSLARSGDSPESAATLNKIRGLFPAVRHIVITCNARRPARQIAEN